MGRKITEKNRQEYQQVFKVAEGVLKGAGFITLIGATRVEQVSLGLQALAVIELQRIATALEKQNALAMSVPRDRMGVSL